MDIIIPHYNADRYRERNLKYVIEHCLKNNNSDIRIIVFEQYNRDNPLPSLKVPVIHIHMTSEDGIFCKSKIINKAIKYCNSDVVMLLDNDCILEPEIFKNVLDDMGDSDYYVPFTDINFLNEGHTRQLIRTGKFTQSKTKSPFHVNRYTGGAIVFTRKIFDKVRGFEESMKRWGKEDDVFLEKCKRVGGKVSRSKKENTLLHIFHPSNVNKKYLKSDGYKYNCELLALFKRMSDDEFTDYINKKQEISSLFNTYKKLKKLETSIIVRCGNGGIYFDTSIYNIVPDEDGKVGLNELLEAAYNGDGIQTVIQTVSEIEKKCGTLLPEEQQIITKYKRLITNNNSPIKM